MLCSSGENIFGERRRSQTAPEDCMRGIPVHLLCMVLPSSSSSHLSAGTPALCCDCLSVPSPLMKAVDNCTQNPKTANTMGLFPLFSPSPQDLCTLCHLAQHGLPWITGRLLQSQLQVEPLQSYRNKSGFVPCRLRTSLPWTCAELDSQGSSQSEIKHNSLQCCFVCRDWAQALCVTKSW